MARFQAQTNAVLERGLDEVREAMGLEPAQKADLLREMTVITAWVLRQAQAGRDIVAEGPDGREVLDTPALHAHRERPTPVRLDEQELEALAHVLAEPPSPAWLHTVGRALDAATAPPTIRWRG